MKAINLVLSLLVALGLLSNCKGNKLGMQSEFEECARSNHVAVEPASSSTDGPRPAGCCSFLSRLRGPWQPNRQCQKNNPIAACAPCNHVVSAPASIFRDGSRPAGFWLLPEIADRGILANISPLEDFPHMACCIKVFFSTGRSTRCG